jgi:hypothetical protein
MMLYLMTLPSYSHQSQFLYLTTIGWKTGKLHKIEIWFVEQDLEYYVYLNERRKHTGSKISCMTLKSPFK